MRAAERRVHIAAIGTALRQTFVEIEMEPVPTRLRELLDQLDHDQDIRGPKTP
jgi:hypothetical protein